MFLKYNPSPFEKDYNKEVGFELDKGKELSAFLLIFCYIEGYLCEWAFIVRLLNEKRLNKRAIIIFWILSIIIRNVSEMN